MSKYVRLKRRDPKHGVVLRQYVYQGIRFLESEGWYVVEEEVADYLRKARQKATDPQSPEAFDICTEKEARAIDEKENLESKPRRPADQARSTQARGLTSKDLQKVKQKEKPRKKASSSENDSKDAETALAADSEPPEEK
jgi:hypothetical protein